MKYEVVFSERAKKQIKSLDKRYCNTYNWLDKEKFK